MIGFETQVMVRFDRIVTGILKLVREELIHQPDAAAFLKLVNHDPATALANGIKCKMELLSAIAALGTENVTGQTLGVDANQRRIVGRGFSHNESQHFFRLVLRFETEELEDPEGRGQARLRNLYYFHQADKYITGPAVVR